MPGPAAQASAVHSHVYTPQCVADSSLGLPCQDHGADDPEETRREAVSSNQDDNDDFAEDGAPDSHTILVMKAVYSRGVCCFEQRWVRRARGRGIGEG
jgi:hypothetical protein